ncbi:hypothetical protein BofuT4_uP097170.1 [Botrytis cinerea T4]|uniref:Uncharacterized protein n=1 Tax=Botryotinia fuckeliana (strain T4) TaxID=999810 RepID=G2YCW1_BOTF4|nr:hypothetical protein BofuT4_uP097170.1 [Botrytis cinerea T4]
MHRFFQIATFLLTLLLVATHDRNIPNSVNKDMSKLSSDLTTTSTITDSIERRD